MRFACLLAGYPEDFVVLIYWMTVLSNELATQNNRWAAPSMHCQRLALGHLDAFSE